MSHKFRLLLQREDSDLTPLVEDVSLALTQGHSCAMILHLKREAKLVWWILPLQLLPIKSYRIHRAKH